MVSASYWSRDLATPIECLGGGLAAIGIYHAGIVLKTQQGNTWLIHHPSDGMNTVITAASNMSRKWRKEKDLVIACANTTV